MRHRHFTVVLALYLCLWAAFAHATTVANDSSTNDELNPEQLASVLALEADIEFGAYLSGECLTCHTPNAANGNIPIIHSKEKEYLTSAILEYKNKQRENDVMRDITAALSIDEIAAIVTYLSAQ